MKTIELTPKEFYLFMELAHFTFKFTVKKQIITVEADANKLAELGY